MRKLILAALILLLASPAWGTSWYVDNAASGANDGTSWTDAWQTFSAISGVGTGDTVYISGGSTSKDYDDQLQINGWTAVPGAAEVSPDPAHVGTVRFTQNTANDGSVSLDTSNSKIDCEVNGVRKCVIEPTTPVNYGIYAVGTQTGLLVRGIEIINLAVAGVRFHNVSGEIDNIHVHDSGNQFDAGVQALFGPDDIHKCTAYDRVLVHDSIIEVDYTEGTGNGADGIQSSCGLTAYNNHFSAVGGTYYVGSQHNDAIQVTGVDFHGTDNYCKIYNNTFTGWAHVSVFLSDPYQYVQVFGNYFYDTRGPIDGGVGETNVVKDFHIYNNTMVDCISGKPGINLEIDTEAGVEDVGIVNNVVVNCPEGIKIQEVRGEWDCGTYIELDYNVSPIVKCKGVSYNQPNYGSTAAPTFVDYIPGGGASNDMRLDPSDTIALDQGSAVGSTWSSTMNDVSRPQGAAWDIGAYETANDVELYGLFEADLTNARSHTNLFDYRQVNLQATFTSPTASTVSWFGFHNGDGAGGQTGTVWTIRFMPDEVGQWQMDYSWSDSASDTGTQYFVVGDTQAYPGKAAVYGTDTRHFRDARGNVLDLRPYGASHAEYKYHSPDSRVWFEPYAAYFNSIMDNYMIPNGYNMMMPGTPADEYDSGGTLSWFQNDTADIFDVSMWDEWDSLMAYAGSNDIYILPWIGMIHHNNKAYMSSALSHYWMARLAPYWNLIGVVPTYEWSTNMWTSSELHDWMTEAKGWDVFNNLFTAHDVSAVAQSDWQDFSMRQAQYGWECNTKNSGDYDDALFNGNCGRLWNYRGFDEPFDERPIFGSEDVWESQQGDYQQPRNANEVRRGNWGAMLIGIYPIYNEFSLLSDTYDGGDMPGQPETKRMFDLWYNVIDVPWEDPLWVSQNSLVSAAARQICSGKPGSNYIIYDDSGGDITVDLSGESADLTFTGTWYDPVAGTANAAVVGSSFAGGASRTWQSPWGSVDTVLYLEAEATGFDPPALTITSPTSSATYSTETTPIDFGGTASAGHTIESVTWAVSESAESGTATGTTSWSDSVDLIEGTNTLRATVQDAIGDTAGDTIAITYTAPEPPPATGPVGPGTFSGTCTFQ